MSSLSSSRVQSPLISPKKKPSHRISTAFKSVGRQTKASWGNRIYKDINDLTYNIKYDQIKGKGQLKNMNRFSKRQKKHSPSKSSQKMDIRPETTSPGNYKKAENIKSLMKGNAIRNPEEYFMEEQKQYSTLQTHGLCKFQFYKTIRGRLTFKPNHHLIFDHQTQRTKNVNPVWYNPKVQVNKMSKTINHSKMEKSHDFNSYTQRSVFEPKEQLDKFYNTKNSKIRCSPKKIKQTVQLHNITGRKEQKSKQSTKLAYDQYEARKMIQPRSASYEIPKYPRKMKFGPQVIWDMRGCYR